MTAALARPARYLASPAPMLHTLLTGVAKNPIEFKTQGFLPGQIALVKSLTSAISFYQAKKPGRDDTARRARFIKTEATATPQVFTLPSTMTLVNPDELQTAIATNIDDPTAPDKVMDVIVLIDGKVATRRGHGAGPGFAAPTLLAGEFTVVHGTTDEIRVLAAKGAEIEVIIPETPTQVTGGDLTQYRTYEVELWSFGFSLGTVEIADAISR